MILKAIIGILPNLLFFLKEKRNGVFLGGNQLFFKDFLSQIDNKMRFSPTALARESQGAVRRGAIGPTSSLADETGEFLSAVQVGSREDCASFSSLVAVG